MNYIFVIYNYTQLFRKYHLLFDYNNVNYFISGMEALETCISYWEDALAAYKSRDGAAPLAVLSSEEAGFCRDLQQLLELALELQENSEMLFLDERSILFKPESAIKEENGFETDLSGGESFASAQDQVTTTIK